MKPLNFKLNLVHPSSLLPAFGVSPRIEVGFTLTGDALHARFYVRSESPAAVNAELSGPGPQWGLWEWDVVELFISCSPDTSRLPYHEFQVSPLGQYFELRIFEPRKNLDREFRSGLKYSAQPLVREPGWQADLEIPLHTLGWNGDPATIQGNAFAILGPKDSRHYWSLFLPPQSKPDFHIPHMFQRLF